MRPAIEFRHRSWYELPQLSHGLNILEIHGVAFVLAHSNLYSNLESEPTTSDFMYLRSHGPDKMFASLYGREK